MPNKHGEAPQPTGEAGLQTEFRNKMPTVWAEAKRKAQGTEDQKRVYNFVDALAKAIVLEIEADQKADLVAACAFHSIEGANVLSPGDERFARQLLKNSGRLEVK